MPFSMTSPIKLSDSKNESVLSNSDLYDDALNISSIGQSVTSKNYEDEIARLQKSLENMIEKATHLEVIQGETNSSLQTAIDKLYACLLIGSKMQILMQDEIQMLQFEIAALLRQRCENCGFQKPDTLSRSETLCRPLNTKILKAKCSAELQFSNTDTLRRWLRRVGLVKCNDGVPVLPDDVQREIRIKNCESLLDLRKNFNISNVITNVENTIETDDNSFFDCNSVIQKNSASDLISASSKSHQFVYGCERTTVEHSSNCAKVIEQKLRCSQPSGPRDLYDLERIPKQKQTAAEKRKCALWKLAKKMSQKLSENRVDKTCIALAKMPNSDNVQSIELSLKNNLGNAKIFDNSNTQLTGEAVTTVNNIVLQLQQNVNEVSKENLDIQRNSKFEYKSPLARCYQKRIGKKSLENDKDLEEGEICEDSNQGFVQSEVAQDNVIASFSANRSISKTNSKHSQCTRSLSRDRHQSSTRKKRKEKVRLNRRHHDVKSSPDDTSHHLNHRTLSNRRNRLHDEYKRDHHMKRSLESSNHQQTHINHERAKDKYRLEISRYCNSRRSRSPVRLKKSSYSKTDGQLNSKNSKVKTKNPVVELNCDTKEKAKVTHNSRNSVAHSKLSNVEADSNQQLLKVKNNEQKIRNSRRNDKKLLEDVDVNDLIDDDDDVLINMDGDILLMQDQRVETNTTAACIDADERSSDGNDIVNGNDIVIVVDNHLSENSECESEDGPIDLVIKKHDLRLIVSNKENLISNRRRATIYLTNFRHKIDIVAKRNDDVDVDVESIESSLSNVQTCTAESQTNIANNDLSNSDDISSGNCNEQLNFEEINIDLSDHFLSFMNNDGQSSFIIDCSFGRVVNNDPSDSEDDHHKRKSRTLKRKSDDVCSKDEVVTAPPAKCPKLTTSVFSRGKHVDMNSCNESDTNNEEFDVSSGESDDDQSTDGYSSESESSSLENVSCKMRTNLSEPRTNVWKSSLGKHGKMPNS